MKQHKNYITAILLLLLSASPMMVSGQASGSSTVSTYYSNQWFYQDGANDSATTSRQRIRQYRQQSDGLSQKISALPSIANQSVYMPVLFGVAIRDISPNFGDPRSGGRTHEGEDIMAVKGTPIVSPTPAVVLKTEVGAGEGNAVYTANPGGETFVYMHLDRFGEGVVSGAVLAQGALIGYVGDTGNAAGGPAHLHFEIHNNAGTPTDPFPRLVGDLSLQDRIADLSKILGQTSDPTALSNFLVTNFRSTFISAQALNIVLPVQITNAMSSVSASTVSTAKIASTAGGLPAGDLYLGSSGPLVVALQTYLIQAGSGSAALKLSAAGATGNFGEITKAALVEYQASVGISPANGYYSTASRTYIAAHPVSSPLQPSLPITSAPINNNPAPAGNASGITRNLYQGITGDDVRALQVWLNANGYTVASTGAGSSGNETSYFGPATTAAVVRFQIAHNISPAAGYVGPLTRTALGSL